MTMLTRDNEFKINPEPPDYLDDAKVIKWAWSGQIPFGFVYSTDNKAREEIFGLAICRYDNSKTIYHFSCNKDWEVVSDVDYESIESAVEELPEQYKNIEPYWHTKLCPNT